MPELDLSIIIPAYKEAKKIKQDVQAAAKFLEAQRIAGEILLVDDGSPDNTVETAKALEKDFPALKVLSYSPNRGKGYALRYGISHSKGRNVMFADAGLCVPYDIAAIGLTMLNLRMCDVAIGSRRMRGSIRREQPLYRRIGSKVYSLVIHTLMGIPWYISDTQCGFKIYQGNVARCLYASAFTDGFMFDIEIILRALADGYQILEFPVLWSNDADTRFNPLRGTWRLFLELVAIRWRLKVEQWKKAKTKTWEIG
jgi:dolichyl-phosphate beta-glucosyltransferase